MKDIFQTSHFKKDFKRVKKRGKDLSKLKEVVSAIAKSEALEVADAPYYTIPLCPPVRDGYALSLASEKERLTTI